ncbi:MAG: hypothetical protein UIH27_15600, partial [Ruminococcus sp.]|nr:hypothetical protein [Ruminococcus sp.]
APMCASAVGVPPLSARGLWGGVISNVALTRKTVTVFLNYVGSHLRVRPRSACRRCQLADCGAA